MTINSNYRGLSCGHQIEVTDKSVKHMGGLLNLNDNIVSLNKTLTVDPDSKNCNKLALSVAFNSKTLDQETIDKLTESLKKNGVTGFGISSKRHRNTLEKGNIGKLIELLEEDSVTGSGISNKRPRNTFKKNELTTEVQLYDIDKSQRARLVNAVQAIQNDFGSKKCAI